MFMEHDRIQLWFVGDDLPACLSLYCLFADALNRAVGEIWHAFALQGGNTLVAVNPLDVHQVALFTYDYVQADENVVVTGRFVLDEQNIPVKWERIPA